MAAWLSLVGERVNLGPGSCVQPMGPAKGARALTRWIGFWIGLVLIALLSGGTDAGPGEQSPPVGLSPPSEVRTEQSPDASSPGPARCRGGEGARSAGRDEVLVFFSCEDLSDRYRPTGFARVVGPDLRLEQRLLAAVEAYLRGPSGPSEQGYVSMGRPGIVNRVAVVGDRAIIDLDLRKAGLTSTTSTQSSLLWAHLKALAFQFPRIMAMEPRFNGSCQAFGTAVEAGDCLIPERGGGYRGPGR